MASERRTSRALSHLRRPTPRGASVLDDGMASPSGPPGFSTASSATAAERQPLLGRPVFTHELDGLPVYSCLPNPHSHLPVYTNIHRIRRDIVSVVEDYLSAEQLRDMRINISVIRPLVDKLYNMDDISIVFCLLVNRAQFLHEQAGSKNRQNVNFTRAALCELIAHRILRRFNEDNEGLEGLLILSHILVAGFSPFQNAPASVREEATDHAGWLGRSAMPALEVAILSDSKLFLSSTACQKVIDAIYVGRVTYTPSTFMDIIPDRYKQKPISLYDPRGASLLNQYRLVVPRTRSILEVCQFVILLGLYLLFMAERDPSRFSVLEIAFAVFSCGWVLDQFATILEHGWHVYTQNLWSFLDVMYVVVYWAYLILRMHGWRTASPAYGQQALDVMAMGAPVLIPRLAFTVLSDNLLFVSLRAMMADFTLLTFLAFWCFAGFLLSLVWLGEGEHHVYTISQWMVYIWFGLDGTGIQRSSEFHWLLGPSLMVTFAFLGNTLFLTVLVSTLSNTFGTIVSNATAEIQYRRAVLTLEGVKNDAIFAYQPPFNIVALVVLVPLKFLVSPRWFHKIHVACVRTINLPVLLIIAAAERRLLWSASPYAKSFANHQQPARPRPRRNFWGKWRITAHSDIQAVFDLPPTGSVEEEIAADDDLTRHLIRRQYVHPAPVEAVAAALNKASSLLAEDVSGEGAAPAAAVVSAAEPSGNSQPPNISTTDGAAGQPSGNVGLRLRRPSLPRSASTVKFAESASSVDGAAAPLPRLKHGLSRRDSIAFPGLDTDKLRTMLSEDGADQLPIDVSSRLDSLEESVARIESMLGRLVGAPGSRGDGSDSSDGGDSEMAERAHSVADDIIDDDELHSAEQTGTLSDLDRTAANDR